MAVIRLINLQSGDCPGQQVSPGIDNQNVMLCYNMDCQLDMAVIRLIILQFDDSTVHQVSPGIDSHSTVGLLV